MPKTLGGEQLLRRFWDLYSAPLRKYATFSGRATRPEFWVFTLVNMIPLVLLSVVDAALGWYSEADNVGVLSGLFALAIVLPGLAVGVRRLHDGNRRGWWILAHSIPVVGALIALYQYIGAGTPGANRFGDDPRDEPVVEMPDDGVPPFAVSKGRYVKCPWCSKTNPTGSAACQWCHKPYREAWFPT
jgi:uncharacterized membrane protein YhaH (DUF805 family)